METKLTEKEFDTIIEALERLPNKPLDGKLAIKLMAKIMLHDNEEAMKKAEDEFMLQDMKEEAEKKECKKKCSIITGKLYMMRENIVGE